MSVYVMNFLDRQIIYIPFPSMKAGMSFSDLRLSLLGAIALFVVRKQIIKFEN